MRNNPLLLLLAALTGLAAIQCTPKTNKLMMDKIQFDYSAIDENGLRNGEVAVDYEFCIPADQKILNQILAIDPGVRVMKSSKGRIGCTAQQWLLINSTHTPEWKKKLFSIAGLDYVDRIVETFYE
jgi:hypothetical protein